MINAQMMWRLRQNGLRLNYGKYATEELAEIAAEFANHMNACDALDARIKRLAEEEAQRPEGAIWRERRTPESVAVETALRKSDFELVDAYQYNSGSIRVRVIHSGFEGMAREHRVARVERYMAAAPADLRMKVMVMFLFTPEEAKTDPENTVFTHVRTLSGSARACER